MEKAIMEEDKIEFGEKYEQELKEFAHVEVCPICSKVRSTLYPKAIGCIYEDNNDEHICGRVQICFKERKNHHDN